MIHRILLLVRKDLLRRARSPLGVLVVLSFPLVFSSILGLVFGTGEPRSPEMVLLVEDHDSDRYFSDRLASVAAGRFEILDIDEGGRELIEADQADALLLIPEAFARDVAAGRLAELQLVRNPSRGIAPEILEQLVRGLTVDPAPATDRIRLETTTLTSASERSGSSRQSVFLFVLPGVAVWALFMVGDLGMRDILVESGAGTLRRQLSSAVSAGELVLAKAILTATLAAVSLFFLSTVGWLATDGSIAVTGFAVLSAALILAVTGFAALVYGLARTERQGATFSSAAVLAAAFLGGAFLPLDNLPATVRSLAPLSPIYWGSSGYRALLVDGAGMPDVLVHVAILAGIGATFLWIGSHLLQRSILAGKLP